jgi:hypothetical protein
MTHSKNITLTSATSTASARSRLAVFTLIALGPLGCTLQSGDEAQADELEQVGEISEALTPAYLPPELMSVPVMIFNRNSGKCLTIPGTANGTNAQQYDCFDDANQTFELFNLANTPTYFIQATNAHKDLNIAANNVNLVMDVGQRFSFEPLSALTYRIGPLTGGKCLDIPYGSPNNGEIVQQYDCHNGDNQQWLVVPRVTPRQLVAKHSGRCVDVYKSNPADGTNVAQFGCRDQANQKWTMGSKTVVGGVPYFSLVANHSGKCMDAAGTNVQQYTCHNGDNQKWQLISFNDGYVSFKNKSANKCMDVVGNNTNDNANIQLYPCGGTDNQRFRWN